MVIDKALNEAPNKRPDKNIKFASDLDKLKFDAENEIISNLQELFEKEKKPGQTFSDWLKSKDDVELKRISLKEGGSPDRSFKPSDIDEFDILKRVNEIMLLRQTLSPRDNAVIDDLLERSLGGKK